MSKKKRVFDIDMPEEEMAETASPVTSAPQRRGPMASAISENAAALQRRKTAAQEIRDENDALAHEYMALRNEGYVVESLPLEQVHSDFLLRDRIAVDDEELGELIASIRDIGLSNPIRVMERGPDDGYELIQGMRRLTAYRRLLTETGDEKWSLVPALVSPLDTGRKLEFYRKMVDENVVRKDLSFAEMAQAARNYAEEAAPRELSVSDAVAELFSSAAYSKRSFIRSFAFLLDQLGDSLSFPTEIPRALGLNLAKEIKTNPDIVARIQDDLKAQKVRNGEEELAVLRQHLTGAEESGEAATRGAEKGRGARSSETKTKTTFHLATGAGRAKCTAAVGRLEIKVDRDFSAIERKKLEQAVADLIDAVK